ncbi:pyridoxamine 5'-phosphate oxidase family protein [Dactylosporangium darangshiense]|uniref:Pyridoxamine 5'-phosphate oxidase N-terminal domain-containing protein n=1 Tax=Dactylosporangium darangshiense TaxID=579108 RepID=A0ABP8DT01_9ACTN
MSLERYARQLLDENRYVVLGTADADGEPWVSPVFYALDGYARLYWLSAPETRHSRNLAVRPALSLVVYDSQVPVGEAKAVYMSGRAEIVAGATLPDELQRYNDGGSAKGARRFELSSVDDSGTLRLYRATIAAIWVLDPSLPRDGRTGVDIASL